MNNNQTNDNREIDLVEVFHVLLRKAWLIIIAAVLAGVIAFVYTKGFVTPLYQSSSTIYIFSETTSITSLADIQVGAQLTEDFRIIAKTRNVLEKVIYELDLDYDYDALSKRIEITNPQSSHMIVLTVTDPDPELAAEISNSLANKLRGEIASIMNTDRPSMVEKAIPAEAASSPSTGRNVIIGALLGALLIVGITLIRYFMDDTIKDEDDIKKYLGVGTLAAIPVDTSRASAKRRSSAPSRGRPAGKK